MWERSGLWVSGQKLLLGKRHVKTQVCRNAPRNQDRLFTMIKTFYFFVFNKCLKAMQQCLLALQLPSRVELDWMLTSAKSITQILEEEVHVVFFPPKFTSTLLKPDFIWHAFYKNNGMMREKDMSLSYICCQREVTSLSVWQLGHKNPACIMFCPQIHHDVNYKYEVWPKHAGWNVPANLYKCFSTLSFQPWALAPPKV